MGGLRLSVERRRVENAKLSAQRYRKFQEFHKRIQKEEMRKALEVLELRKKKQDRLNNYIHSLHQPRLKSHNLRFQNCEEFIKRNQNTQRPPWTLSYLKHNKNPSKSSQKENSSIIDTQLFGLQQPDFDVMLQIRATSIRDALVDLKACNSRYPINDADQYKCPLAEDSYLKNHFLRAREWEEINLEVVGDENCTISKSRVDEINRKNKVSTPPFREEFKRCRNLTSANNKFQGHRTNNFKVNDSQIENLTKFRQRDDGKTTSCLTKEVILSSLESNATTTRLVEEFTTNLLNSCELIPIQTKAIPCEEFDCSKTSLNCFKKKIENQPSNARIKSNQCFENESTNSKHGVLKPMNINEMKLASNGVQKTQLTNQDIRSCPCDEKEKNCTFIKRGEPLTCDEQNGTIKYCPLEELHTCSFQVLCAPNHGKSQTSKNTSTCIKRRCSSQNELRSEDDIENQRRITTSSSGTNISHESHSSNSFSNKNPPRGSSKKSNIPQHILQSVYERCDLDAIKNLGYAHLCDVSHLKKENISKSLHDNHSRNNAKDLSPEEITSTSSYANDANLHNCEKTTMIDVEPMYYNLSRHDGDLGKENRYTDLHSPRLEEELNILASLERLDWKLATQSSRSLISERNSLTSQGGQLSSKSTKSAPAILLHDSSSSETLRKTNLVIGKPKKNCNVPPIPLSTRTIPKKPPTNHRQRQVVGVTNKNQGRSIHQFHTKSDICTPSSHLVFEEKSKITAPTLGSIVCCKDLHCLFSPMSTARGSII